MESIRYIPAPTKGRAPTNLEGLKLEQELKSRQLNLMEVEARATKIMAKKIFPALIGYAVLGTIFLTAGLLCPILPLTVFGILTLTMVIFVLIEAIAIRYKSQLLQERVTIERLSSDPDIWTDQITETT